MNSCDRFRHLSHTSYKESAKKVFARNKILYNWKRVENRGRRWRGTAWASTQQMRATAIVSLWFTVYVIYFSNSIPSQGIWKFISVRLLSNSIRGFYPRSNLTISTNKCWSGRKKKGGGGEKYNANQTAQSFLTICQH